MRARVSVISLPLTLTEGALYRRTPASPLASSPLASPLAGAGKRVDSPLRAAERGGASSAARHAARPSAALNALGTEAACSTDPNPNLNAKPNTNPTLTPKPQSKPKPNPDPNLNPNPKPKPKPKPNPFILTRRYPSGVTAIAHELARLRS